MQNIEQYLKTKSKIGLSLGRASFVISGKFIDNVTGMEFEGKKLILGSEIGDYIEAISLEDGKSVMFHLSRVERIKE